MMNKNVFSSMIRKASKYKIYAFINIGGLSISFALAILVFLYAYNEFHTDSFHTNKDRIFRIVNAQDGCAFTGPMLAEELKERFPEIEAVTRVRHNDGGLYKYKDETYTIKYDMCFDSAALDIFSFEWIAGNKKEALRNSFSIVLTQSMSRKIFKDSNPIGQNLRYNNLCDMTVTGVIKDLPVNSTFSIDAILPFHILTYLWDGNPNKPSNILKERDNESFHTYILFKKNTNVRQIEEKISAFIDEKSAGRDFKLQNLSNIYFDKNDRDRWVNKGDLSMVKLLLSIAIGLLIMSIINYINLNTAITTNNLFHLGVRKLLGAKIRHFVISSFIETIIYFSVSLLLAIIIIHFLKKPFFSVLSADYSLASIISFKYILITVLIFVIIALLSGVIPVHFFKRYSPVAIVHQKHLGSTSANLLNKSLIIIQFLITVIFIISTLFIGKQVYYINHKNLGFQKDLLVYVNLKTLRINKSQTNLLKANLLSSPQIKSVSFSAGMFGDVRRGMNSEINGISRHYRRIHTDPDYIKTMQYQLAEGRDFSWDMTSDLTSGPYIINEAMAKAFDMKDPMKIKIDGHQVIGVVKNFHFESIHKNIEPVVLICNPGEANWIANIRLSSNDLNGAMQSISTTFKTIIPDYRLDYTYADDRIASYYKKENQFSELSVIFSIISICISCIGLIGLVMFITSQKIKEIGIRKINGAKVFEILGLLNKSFAILVGAAFIIACPISWYAMNKWLENFAYKTALSWWIFAAAGIIALIIALFTVSWQSWRAASKNPVESLRYE